MKRMSININTALFGFKGDLTILGRKFFRSGGAGSPKSEKRPGSACGNPKISTAARIFEVLLNDPGKIAAYQSDESAGRFVICDIDGVTTLADGETIRTTGELGHLNELIPEIIFQLSSFGENEELKKLFASIVETVNTTSAIEDAVSSVFKFCDSFYYGCVKDHKAELEYREDLTSSEVEALFRAGGMNKIPVIEACADDHLAEFDTSWEEEPPVVPEETSDKAESEAVESKAPKAKPKDKKKVEYSLEIAKEGAFVLDYEWDEAIKENILPLSYLEGYKETPEFCKILRYLHQNLTAILDRMKEGLTGVDAIGTDVCNVLVGGKCGTGKTATIYAVCAALGLPVDCTANSKNTEEDSVEGKTKIVDGKPQFVDTWTVKTAVYGGANIEEEINLLNPRVAQGSLGQLLEKPYKLYRNGFEPVIRHPLMVVFATMNVGTNGTFPMNQATANRFQPKLIMRDPEEKDYIAILSKSGASKEKCEWVLNAYNRTIDYLRSPSVRAEELVENLSMRDCMSALKLMDRGFSPKEALMDSIVSEIEIVDLEIGGNIRTEVIDPLPEPKFK